MPQTSTGNVRTRVLQFLCAASGAGLLGWACLNPRFRDAEGFLSGRFCLPASAALALFLLAFAAAGEWRRSALWLALTSIGQAAALQMIDAGPLIHYQRYRPIEHRLPLLIFAAQSILVASALWRRRQGLRNALEHIMSWWKWLLVAVLVFLPAVPVARNKTAYAAELVFGALVEGAGLAGILLVAWNFPSKPLYSLKERIAQLLEHPVRVPAVAVAAAWVAVLAAGLNLSIYERHPHIPDEVSYVLQARYFASGKLAMPAPAAPEAVNVDLMTYEPARWYSPFPPGWPAVLALGVLLGLPWLLNPLLGGLNILLAYVFLQDIYDARTARFSVLLLAASPWYVFMAMNWMAHTFTLTCSLVAGVAMGRAHRSGSAAWAGIAGLSTGLVSLIRPLEGAVIGALLALWAIGLGGRRLPFAGLAALAAGAAVFGGFALPYNKALTGRATVFPVMAYFDKYYGPGSNAMGFGPNRGVGWPLDAYPGHSPSEALINSDLNAFSVNIELFGWATGSLLPVALLLLPGSRRRADRMMLALIAAIFCAHAFYWYSGGPDFGARYWFLMVIPLAALSSRGLESLGALLGAPRVYGAAFCLCLLAVAGYFPWRALDKYHHYLHMRPDIRRLSEQYHFGGSLVLIQGARHPDFASAAVYNPLDVSSRSPASAAIYAWDRDSQTRARALEAYPARPVWIVAGPTITGGGFQLVAGPFPPDKVGKK